MTPAPTLQLILDELTARLDPRKRVYPGDDPDNPYNILEPVPRISCANGLSFSCQAGRTHYCSPRDNFGPWDKVELGFPTQRIEALANYAEEWDDPTDTVYAYVPLELVAQIILDAGGFAPTEVVQ